MGTDRAGNKFFENNEELPLRTRWVEYAKHDYDAAHIEPGWHAWISYSLDTPPTEDALIKAGTRHFEPTKAIPNYTQTRGAFKTYNTYVSSREVIDRRGSANKMQYQAQDSGLATRGNPPGIRESIGCRTRVYIFPTSGLDEWTSEEKYHRSGVEFKPNISMCRLRATVFTQRLMQNISSI